MERQLVRLKKKQSSERLDGGLEGKAPSLSKVRGQTGKPNDQRLQSSLFTKSVSSAAIVVVVVLTHWPFGVVRVTCTLYLIKWPLRV